jgi:hemerythrin-like metal-binding protein
MALLEWKDDYRIGVAAVDHEHRDLIDLINYLYEDLSLRPVKEKVLNGLGEIYARISAHFALEERVMRERGYDQYLDHKADHERLLDEIRDIMDRYEADAYFNYEDALGRELGAWFAEHFRTKDARLHKVLGDAAH